MVLKCTHYTTCIKLNVSQTGCTVAFQLGFEQHLLVWRASSLPIKPSRLAKKKQKELHGNYLPITHKNWKHDYHQENPKIYLEGGCENVIFVFLYLLFFLNLFGSFTPWWKKFTNSKFPHQKSNKSEKCESPSLFCWPKM